MAGLVEGNCQHCKVILSGFCKKNRISKLGRSNSWCNHSLFRNARKWVDRRCQPDGTSPIESAVLACYLQLEGLALQCSIVSKETL